MLDQSQNLDISVDKFNLDGDSQISLREKRNKQESEKKTKGKIITDENEEKIAISFDTYKRWFSRYYGISFFICS